MIGEEVLFLSVRELGERIRARKLSPVELLSALIARSERLNPEINCWADRYFDEALAKAKAAAPSVQRPSVSSLLKKGDVRRR